MLSLLASVALDSRVWLTVQRHQTGLEHTCALNPDLQIALAMSYMSDLHIALDNCVFLCKMNHVMHVRRAFSLCVCVCPPIVAGPDICF